MELPAGACAAPPCVSTDSVKSRDVSSGRSKLANVPVATGDAVEGRAWVPNTRASTEQVRAVESGLITFATRLQH